MHELGCLPFVAARNAWGVAVLDTVRGRFVRLGALGNAGVDAFIDAFLSRKLFDFCNGASHFHTNGTVHSTPSIEAYAYSVGAQTVVGTTVGAQFHFTGSSGEPSLALALAGGFVAYTVLVAVVWARANVAGGSAPGLGAVLAGLAVAFTSHRVARTVARAIFRAFLVAAVGSKKVSVACACTVDAQTVAGAHLAQVIRWAAFHAAIFSGVAFAARALGHVANTVSGALVRAIFFAARFAVVADCAFAQGNAGGGVARTVVVTVVWATWKGAIVSHEPTVALALAV
jgi:hypothetical protein